MPDNKCEHGVELGFYESICKECLPVNPYAGNRRFALVHHQGEAMLLASKLINLSKWFEVEPWPDNAYHFTAKNEPNLPEEFNR